MITDRRVVAFANCDIVFTESANGDVPAAARGDDVITTDRHVSAVNGEQFSAGVDCRETVVAENHIIAVGRVNCVLRGTAEHDVHSATGDDGVCAAVGCIQSRDACDLTGCVDFQLAVVTGDEVVALDDGNFVVGEPTQYDVVSGTGSNRIVIADRWCDRLDVRVLPRFIKDEAGVVADCRVVAFADCDDVFAESANGNVFACACCDPVVTSDVNKFAVDCQQQACGVESNEAVVADDNVVAVAPANGIVRGSAKNDVVSVTGRHVICAAVRFVERFQTSHLTGRICRDTTVVRRHKVVTAVDGHSVVANTCQNRVVAGTECDGVVATQRWSDRFGNLPSQKFDERNTSAVTDDQIVAFVAVDVVVGQPADNNVVARAGHDRVCPTDIGVGGRQLCQQARSVVRQHCVVANQHVLSARSSDGIVAVVSNDNVVSATDFNRVAVSLISIK